MPMVVIFMVDAPAGSSGRTDISTVALSMPFRVGASIPLVYDLPGVAQRSLRDGMQGAALANSSAIGKRRNAADRPQRPLPEGLERNRAIERLGCLHGHEPTRRTRKHPLIPIALQRDPWEIVNRLLRMTCTTPCGL
ncbi:MAG: hypothetical protein BGO35_01930 [Burkholderiales bacterium 64-34]|nr:MAG: hypothetical protein BGO35_01930 [Burkholderiales bacterium 64-34]